MYSITIMGEDFELIYDDFNSPTAKAASRNLFAILEKMYGEEINTDVKFIAKGEEIKAHKSFLIAASPVFAAMFQNDFKEKTDNTVIVEDVNPAVFRQMLKFMYTTKISNLESLAPQLLFASEKYDIIHLKTKCEKHLINEICAGNCIDNLRLAHMTNAVNLKNAVIKFIENNYAEVSVTEEWKNFHDATLLKEMYIHMHATRDATPSKRPRLA